MNLLRSIGMDLVEKRLWPVAAALGAGAVVAPVAAQMTARQAAVVNGAPGLSQVAHPAPLTPAESALMAQMRPDAGVVHQSLGAPLRDPFLMPAATTSSPSTQSTHSAGASHTLGPASPTTSHITHTSPITPVGSPGHTAPSPVHVSPPTPSPVHVVRTPHPRHPSRPAHRGGGASALTYHVALRFGSAATLRTITDPVRLSPLPSAADPKVVYLGVTKGAGQAAFLLPHGGVASGDGTCSPDPGHCQVLKISPGGTEFLDILDPAVGLVQYELDLVSISARRASTRAAARRSHVAESSVGRQILKRSSSTALSQLMFSPALGTIVSRGEWNRAHPAARQRLAARRVSTQTVVTTSTAASVAPPAGPTGPTGAGVSGAPPPLSAPGTPDSPASPAVPPAS